MEQSHSRLNYLCRGGDSAYLRNHLAVSDMNEPFFYRHSLIIQPTLKEDPVWIEQVLGYDSKRRFYIAEQHYECKPNGELVRMVGFFHYEPVTIQSWKEEGEFRRWGDFHVEVRVYLSDSRSLLVRLGEYEYRRDNWKLEWRNLGYDWERTWEEALSEHAQPI